MKSVYSIPGAGAALALALLAAAPLAARADTLGPRQAVVQALGPISVTTYYTSEDDGFHVVTTAAKTDGDAASVIRVISVLTDGQRTVVSVPRDAGQPDLRISMRRSGDRLVVEPLGSKFAAR